MTSKAFNIVLVFLVAVTITACTAITPVPPNSAAIVLDHQQTRNYWGSTFTVTFPKGRYEAAFQTPAGTYYSAPSTLVLQAVGHTIITGGIFLPRAGGEDQKQGFYASDSGDRRIAIRKPLDYKYSP